MKTMIMFAATAMCLGAVTISAPDTAQARFGAEAIAQATAGISSTEPARYYRSYRRYPGYYGAYGAYGSAYDGPYGGAYGGAYGAYAFAPSPSPSPNYNFWYNAPAQIYSGSREALDTCALC